METELDYCKSILDLIPSAVALYTQDQRLLFCNRAFGSISVQRMDLWRAGTSSKSAAAIIIKSPVFQRRRSSYNVIPLHKATSMPARREFTTGWSGVVRGSFWS